MPFPISSLVGSTISAENWRDCLAKTSVNPSLRLLTAVSLPSALIPSRQRFVKMHVPKGVQWERGRRTRLQHGDIVHRKGCYKLHALCGTTGAIHSFDMTAANVHDLHYLKDVRWEYHDCVILGDKGYLSAPIQQDLFSPANIILEVSYRARRTGDHRHGLTRNSERE